MAQRKDIAMPAGVIRAAAMCTLVFVAASLQAQSHFEEDFNDEDKPWQEIAVQLPPAPKQENLLPFFSSPSQSFAIDSTSVSVGTDGVVRYVLVATSTGGARNVSYEGIRCAAFERKLYAFGQQNGSWSRSRRDQWERISGNAVNRQHAVLAKDYFCEQLMVAGNARQMVERIREQKPMTSENYR
jgi:hypothetical protein